MFFRPDGHAPDDISKRLRKVLQPAAAKRFRMGAGRHVAIDFCGSGNVYQAWAAHRGRFRESVSLSDAQKVCTSSCVLVVTVVLRDIHLARVDVTG